MTERSRTATWASALALAVLAGAGGFIVHAALTESRAPVEAPGPPPAPGLLSAVGPEGANAAVSAAPGAATCGASDCACQRREALSVLDSNAGAERFLAALEAAAPGACSAMLAGARVEALARTNRCAEALAATQALTPPIPGEADYALALCAYRAGNRDEARRRATSAVEHGRDGAGHLLLGMIALDAAELDLAEVELSRAVQLSPHLADAHYNYGAVLHRLGRYNKARAAYLAALHAEPRYHDARHQLILLTAQAGALLEARHHLEQLRGAVGQGDERVQGAEARVRELSAAGSQALTLPGSR